jgi:hypothetical protein
MAILSAPPHPSRGREGAVLPPLADARGSASIEAGLKSQPREILRQTTAFTTLS